MEDINVIFKLKENKVNENISKDINKIYRISSGNTINKIEFIEIKPFKQKLNVRKMKYDYLKEKIKYKSDKNEIILFGKTFIDANSKKCLLIINNKKTKLVYRISKKIKNEIFNIKLIILDNIIVVNSMFQSCSSLIALPDISKWNTNNLENMNKIFYQCSSLISLPDISKWNTNNVYDMSKLFYGCSSLESLPDISKWNTNRVLTMCELFCECSSLTNLPDLSKWRIDNVMSISCLFSECHSLISLPDISKWNTKK